MSPRTIAEAFGRSGGPEGIRWLLQSGASRAALERRLVSMLAPGADVRWLRIRSAAVNPAHRLRAGFDATVRGPGPGAEAARQVYAVWVVKGAELPAPPPENPPIPPRTAAPFRQLVATDDEWKLRLWVWPFDPSFRALARLADPEYAGQVLAGVWPDRWAARWGRAGPCTVQPIRYVPRTAHALRYDPPGGRGAGPGSLAVKLSSNLRLAAIRREAIAAAAGAVATSPADAAIVAPIGEADGALLYPWVQATSLAHVLAPGAQVGPHLRSLGTAVAALQGVPADGRLPVLSLDDEIRRAGHAARPLVRLAPELADEVSRTLERVRAAAGGPPLRTPVLAHGDLKAEHVLLHAPAGVRLIDLDACVRADPALDLGRLMADLRWANRSAGDAGARAAQEPFLEGYRARAALPPELLARVRAYEVVTFVRAALHYAKLWRADWRRQAEAAVAQAAALAREL